MICLTKAQRDAKLPGTVKSGSGVDIGSVGGLFDAIGSGAGYGVVANGDGQGNNIATFTLPDGRTVTIAISANGAIDVSGFAGFGFVGVF